ncbi:hypothetical protein BDZ89DRAFT_240088 [Hymenopellis radicata]|nr:hypothetical protein BDZ89DRAFT_240088 [Hymenopellis radicata]
MCTSYRRAEPSFSSMKIGNEASVTAITTAVVTQVSGITFTGYGVSTEDEPQYRLMDQMPDHVWSFYGERRVVLEDKGWRLFDHTAPSIVALARSEEGKRLQRNSTEQGARAILYKVCSNSVYAMLTPAQIAVAMFDLHLWWGILFGGDQLLLFQRVMSTTQSTRYGVLCSEILPINRLCLITLGMILVPGGVPLVDVASFKIPVPAACPPSNLPILTRDRVDQLFPVAEDDHDDEERESAQADLGSLTSLEALFLIDGYEPTSSCHCPLGMSHSVRLRIPPLFSPRQSLWFH